MMERRRWGSKGRKLVRREGKWEALIEVVMMCTNLSSLGMPTAAVLHGLFLDWHGHGCCCAIRVVR